MAVSKDMGNVSLKTWEGKLNDISIIAAELKMN